jgi:hypothetical protein
VVEQAPLYYFVEASLVYSPFFLENTIKSCGSIPFSFTQKMPFFQQGQQFTLFKARKHFKSNHTTTSFLFQLNVRQIYPKTQVKKIVFVIIPQYTFVHFSEVS